jgi:Domain of unknown function (DUF4384)/BON domain
MKTNHRLCLHNGWLNCWLSLVAHRPVLGLFLLACSFLAVAGCSTSGKDKKPLIPIPAVLSKPRPPQEVVTEVRSNLASFTCCHIQIKKFQDGIVSLAGRVESPEQQQNIIQVVKGVSGVVDVETDFTVVPPSFREVMSVLRAFQPKSPGSNISIRPSKGCDEVYYRDEPLVLDVQAEKPLRYVYIDYYPADETNVAHLFPNPKQQDNLMKEATSLQLGGWSFDAPFGMELVTVVSSSMPLIYPKRLAPEPIGRYLPELQKALSSRPPNAIVTAQSCLITTQAAPAPSPPATSDAKEKPVKPALPGKAEVPQNKEADESSAVTFFDIEGFDKKLSSVLKERQPMVKVNFHAPADINKIPERLEKWLAAVQKEDGNVELLEDPEYKGQVTRSPVAAALGVLQMIPMLYNMIKDNRLYSPAENYNATVYYIKGKGTITKVIFSQKN